MSFEIGIGGWREFLWIPASLLLLPGVLLALAVGALDISWWLAKWYSIPLFTLVVAANAASWAIVAHVARKRKSTAQQGT